MIHGLIQTKIKNYLSLFTDNFLYHFFPEIRADKAHLTSGLYYVVYCTNTAITMFLSSVALVSVLSICFTN